MSSRWFISTIFSSAARKRVLFMPRMENLKRLMNRNSCSQTSVLPFSLPSRVKVCGLVCLWHQAPMWFLKWKRSPAESKGVR